MRNVKPGEGDLPIISKDMKHYFQVWFTGNREDSQSCHRYETIEDMDRLIDFYKNDLKVRQDRHLSILEKQGVKTIKKTIIW